MKSKEQAHEMFDLLCHQFGAPEAIVSDRAKKVFQGEYRKKARESGVHLWQILPYSPFKKRAESTIHENKRMTMKWMIRS